jgi:hypothetical protein
MSAPLVLLFLIGTAAIVWSTCFVGCSFHPGSAQVSDFSQYQNTLTTTPGIVALWPLNDTSGTIAVDVGPNHFNGGYVMGPVVTTYNAGQQSDASPGTFGLDQPGIVAGDTINGNPFNPNPCVYFNGGFVEVLWQAALGPPQFTIEAWVRPDWSDAKSDPSNRVVVASADLASFAGFALFASTSNLWEVQIGIGSQFVSVTTGANQTITQDSLYFLVVTYDGTNLTLWVNPADTAAGAVAGGGGINTSASGYVPVPSPIPLYIGQGRPDLTTGPLFPFKGWIQDVAFYNKALDDETIEKHYLNGSGMQVS